MKKGMVIAVYVLGAMVFLAGLGIMIARVFNSPIGGPVEALVFGGFGLLVIAKLLGSKMVDEVNDG